MKDLTNEEVYDILITCGIIIYSHPPLKATLYIKEYVGKRMYKAKSKRTIRSLNNIRQSKNPIQVIISALKMLENQ